MKKVYFDQFSIANMKTVEANAHWCEKCNKKTILTMIMLGDPEEYRKGMLGIPGASKYPEGELSFCKGCKDIVLIIYNRTKEKDLIESVKNIKRKLKP